MNILLGIFSTPTFKEWEKKKGIDSFPFKRIFRGREWIDLKDMIILGLKKCQICYFVVDDLILPLNPELSITCKELKWILENPELLKKVIFIKDGKELISEESEKYLK